MLMKRHVWLLLVATLFVSSDFRFARSAQTEATSSASDQTFDFDRDIMPVLAKNCVACHNTQKAEGGLNLESHAKVLQGGDSGPAVEAGNSQSGTLLTRVIDDSDPMPPADNSVGASRLTESEVAAIRSWVEAGAAATQEPEKEKLRWQTLPDSIHPVYAMAASADGNYLAFGRGNQAYIIRQSDMDSELQAFELADATVAQELQNSSGVAPGKNAAHLDIVQSIAFSPDSQTLATGGYRDVKLWQRRTGPTANLEGAISFSTKPVSTSISPDGSRIAAALGQQLEVVHLSSGQASRYLKSHLSQISAIVWLEDCSRLLSADTAGSFVLTDCSKSNWNSLALKTHSIPESSSVQNAEAPNSSEVQSENSIGGLVETDAKLVCHEICSLGNNRFAAIDKAGQLFELVLDVEQLNLTVRSVDGLSGVTAMVATLNGIANGDGTSTTILALGSESGICRIVNSATWQVAKELTIGEPVLRLALSPTGNLLATSSGQTPSRVWRLEDGACISTLDRDYNFSQMVSNAQRNASRQQSLLDRLNARLGEETKAAESEEAARAKVQESREKAAQELTAKEAAIGTAAESLNQAEQALAAAEAALVEAMKHVEVRKGELEMQRKGLEEAKSQKDRAATELVSRDQALATAQDATQRAAQRIPETQQQISTETQKLELLRQSHQQMIDQPQTPKNVQHIAFGLEGSQVVIADDSGKQHVFSTKDGSPIAILEADSAICGVRVVGRESLHALTGSGKAIAWDLSFPWELQRTIGSYGESPWSDRITAMDFSPDGSQLAVGSGSPSRSGEIKIVGVETGEIVLDLGEVHSDTVFAIKFSPDGKLIASGAADKQCRLFDAGTGAPRGVLEGHTHHVLSLSWKDDGVTLATGSADNSVKVWNVETGTQVRTVGGFKKEVTSLAFIGQTDQFVATDASGIAQLLSASEGKQIRAFAGADSPIHAIGVSSDGKLLFAGGQTGSQWAWQIEDGKKLK